MAIVTPLEVRSELAIDYADEMIDARIDRLILEADSYLEAAIGDRVAEYYSAVPSALPQLQRLALMYIGDIYDSRGVSAGSKLSNAAEKRQQSLMAQCLNGYRIWLDTADENSE